MFVSHLSKLTKVRIAPIITVSSTSNCGFVYACPRIGSSLAKRLHAKARIATPITVNNPSKLRLLSLRAYSSGEISGTWNLELRFQVDGCRFQYFHMMEHRKNEVIFDDYRFQFASFCQLNRSTRIENENLPAKFCL